MNIPPSSLYERIRRIERTLRAAGLNDVQKVPITSWQAMDLPLDSGWSPSGTPYADPAFYRDAQGNVHLRGAIAGGTNGPIFVMDPGYIPAQRSVLSAQGAGLTVVRIDVQTDGTVRVVGTVVDNSFVSLDGLYYRAEQ